MDLIGMVRKLTGTGGGVDAFRSKDPARAAADRMLEAFLEEVSTSRRQWYERQEPAELASGRAILDSEDRVLQLFVVHAALERMVRVGDAAAGLGGPLRHTGRGWARRQALYGLADRLLARHLPCG